MKHLVTAVPWMECENGDKAAYLIRQFISRSLYDRLNTRPFLTLVEKKWIAYQLLRALESIHNEDCIENYLAILLLKTDFFEIVGL